MRQGPAMVLAVALLTGCQGGGDPPPMDRYHRLAASPPAAAGLPVLSGVLLVARLDAEGLMRERPLVYSLDDRAFTLAQHDYDFWVESPPRLVQAQLVAYLRSAGVAESVVTPDLRVRSDFEVIGTIRRFERLVGGTASKVAVALELALIDPGGDRLRVVDTYVAEIDCSDATVETAVAAFNEALTSVFAAFVADIRRAGSIM